jgi:hypothetical protein
MSEDRDGRHRAFSWWDKQRWKPEPPAEKESHRPGFPHDRQASSGELPQGEQKSRLNNPKKRGHK